MRKFLKKWAVELARDDGVAGLIIVMIIMAVAATSLMIFLNSTTGPMRTLERIQSMSGSQSRAYNAVMVSFAQFSTLPCPDTDLDGAANTPCAGTGIVRGTLPYATLGLSRDDAIDAYGRYYDYIIAAPATEQAFCVSVENDFGGDPEYTGQMNPNTSLEVRTSGAADGTFVPFALLSHGVNGLGGIPANSTTVTRISGAANDEATNASPSSIIYSGPYDATTASYFDDVVMVPTRAKLQKLCEDKSPGGAMNAVLGDDFNATRAGNAFDSTKWATSGSPTQQNGVANFSGAGDYITTLGTAEFSPGVRPIYVSAVWTPASASNTFSILTRATPGSATDVLDFTFGSSTSISNDNTLSATPPTAAITIAASRRYLLEVYDNGTDVWARITDEATPTTTATVRATGVTHDLTGDNRVIFRSNTGANTLDDVRISFPMLSLQTGNSAYATAPSSNGTASSLTLEAWVRPISTVSGSIVAKWDSGSGGAATSAFRLYIDNGAAMLQLNDGTANQAVNLGIGLTANTWTHVAVTYNATSHQVRAYKDGQFAASVDTTLTGGLFASTEEIGFGADTVGGVAANPFTGQISDVRIWNAVRSAAEIATCYQTRLGSATCSMPASLVSNFRLDPSQDDGGFSYTVLAAADGTSGLRNTATWTPAASLIFRPTSADLCPSNQYGAYRCDFRTAATNTVVPLTTLSSIHAKVWGGGGGGYDLLSLTDQPGGGGGFGSGLIPNTAGQIRVTIGAGGAGGSDALLAAVAGDPSAVDYTSTDLILANGGVAGALANPGNQGSASFPLGSALNIQAASSVPDEDGAACVPAGDPCTDASYVSVGNNNTARGGAAGNNDGQTGLIILLW